MGGSSKSSNQTSTTTLTEHNTDIDNTSMMGDGTFVEGDGNTIHSSDAEVLKHLGTESMGLVSDVGGGVADIANKALDGSAELGRTAGNLGSSAFSSARSMGDSAFNLAGDTNRTMSDLAGYFGAGAFDLADNVSWGLMKLAEGSNITAAESSKNAMTLVDNFTRREQTGTEGEAIRWVVIGSIGVAGFAALQMMRKK